jgi:hypothetical protein
VKKRDRTTEEKAWDAIVKTAVMKLGPNSPTASQPTPFPYRLVWDRLGRKGQRANIVRQSTKTAQVRFEDGFETVIDRKALRRI